MSKSVITERQQYWLDHVEAADAFNGTLVELAKVEGLKVKDPNQWKTILTRLSFLACKAKAPAFAPRRTKKKRKHTTHPTQPLAETVVPLAPLSWAEQLKRVFKIDIERCPKCGGKFF